MTATLETIVIRVDGEDKTFNAPAAQELRYGLTTGDRVIVTVIEAHQGACINRIEKVE